MRLEFHPSARDEFVAASDYYDAAVSGLGNRLLIRGSSGVARFAWSALGGARRALGGAQGSRCDSRVRSAVAWTDSCSTPGGRFRVSPSRPVNRIPWRRCRGSRGSTAWIRCGSSSPRFQCSGIRRTDRTSTSASDDGGDVRRARPDRRAQTIRPLAPADVRGGEATANTDVVRGGGARMATLASGRGLDVTLAGKRATRGDPGRRARRAASPVKLRQAVMSIW